METRMANQQNNQQIQQTQQSKDKKSPSGAPLRTRKSNGKSRGGCLVCKKRRIKCDELRPSCTRCKSQLHKCVYASSGVPRWKDNVTSFALSKLAKAPQAPEPETHEVPIQHPSSGPEPFDSIWDMHAGNRPPQITPYNQIQFMSSEDCGQFDTRDALLLVSFDTNTMQDLVGAPSLWGEVLQLAFQHDFLFHAMLALSARHVRKVPTIASASSNYDFRRLENHHLQKALSTYHPSMQEINPQNPEALVSTSFILYFYMCSVLDFDPFAPIPCEDTSFKYLRGICSVITSGPDVRMKVTLFRSLIAKPVHFPYWMEETNPVMGPGAVVVNFLDDMPSDPLSLQSETSKGICRTRMASLAPYVVASTKPGLSEDALQELLIGFKRWQAHVPLEFDLLVQAFEPMSLVVLAHFYAAIGTVISRMTSTWWWWQEKPGFMIDTISRYLGPEWDICMAWPKKMAMTFRGKSAYRDPLIHPCRMVMDVRANSFERPYEAWV